MIKNTRKDYSNIFILVSLVNFFIAACLGLAMRYAFVWEAGWMKYKNVMYAHSNGALTGWMFMALSVLLWKVFGPSNFNKAFAILFTMSELSVVGMFLSFFAGGFNSYSFLFFLLFIVLSFFMIFKLWSNASKRSGEDILLLKSGLVWLALSWLGILVLIPVVYFRNSEWYNMAIQFFLHFQLNGWLLFAVMALFFNQLTSLGIQYPKKYFRLFLLLLVISTVLTFALAITWINPDLLIFIVNSIGVLIQLAALVLFFKIITQNIMRQYVQKIPSFPRWILGFALVSFVLKILIQTVVVLPEMATISYTIRLFVLGFLHLITLGFVSAFVLGSGFISGLLTYNNLVSRTGWILLFAGIVITELVLFGQGIMVWFGFGYLADYHLIIFITSILLPLGILIAIIGQFINNKKNFIPNTVKLWN